MNVNLKQPGMKNSTKIVAATLKGCTGLTKQTHIPDIVFMEVDILEECSGNVLLGCVLCHIQSCQVDEWSISHLHHGGRSQPHVAP